MKHIIITMTLLLGMSNLVGAQNTAIDKYFQKYAEAEEFTSVYVSEYMFSMFAEVDPEDPEDKEVMDILKGLKSLHVLTCEENGLKLYEEAIKLIDKTEYKVLMKVKDGGTKVQFLIKKEGNQVKELLLLVGEEDEFVLLNIVGNIDLGKISKLAKHMDIDGLDYLDKVESN